MSDTATEHDSASPKVEGSGRWGGLLAAVLLLLLLQLEAVLTAGGEANDGPAGDRLPAAESSGGPELPQSLFGGRATHRENPDGAFGPGIGVPLENQQ